ncbi:hypothetical protein JCM10212_005345 [Sporobolomyces blumeae]
MATLSSPPRPSERPASALSTASGPLPPPPNLPLPPLPGCRLSFDVTRAPGSPSANPGTMTHPRSPARSATTSNRTTTTEDDDEDDDDDDERDGSGCSSHDSTSPSSLTPTLPNSPSPDAKPHAQVFPSAKPRMACPFPTRIDKAALERRRAREQEREQVFGRDGEAEEESDGDESNDDEVDEDDCGCGGPPPGVNESDDDLDVLEFVLRDQSLALKTTSSAGQRQAGETGLGLFKRPGIEGLSLSPAQKAEVEKAEQNPPAPLRRPSTAPEAGSISASGGLKTIAKHERQSSAPTKFVLPRIRIPRPNSSESDDFLTSSDDSAGTAKRRLRKRKPARPFDRFLMPTAEDLAEARQCELVGETGVTVTLDEIVKARGRVVFVALRHFWCGLCAQYVAALREAMLSLVAFRNSVSELSAAASSVSVGDYHAPRAVIPPLYIVLVSTGSHKLIPTYRQRLDCPFPLYVDRSRKLYKTLGMTKKTWDMGKESEKGSYIVKSNWQNVVESTKAGIAMPKYPGPQSQLGGEFVFDYNESDDSISCSYASRMHTTRAHAEIRELFAAAGVELTDEDAASVYGESVYTTAS